MREPIPGAMVRYTSARGKPLSAIVFQVWRCSRHARVETLVDLTVWFDDGAEPSMVCKVAYDPDGGVRSWRWPS
jgi:hypothetical protein